MPADIVGESSYGVYRMHIGWLIGLYIDALFSMCLPYAYWLIGLYIDALFSMQYARWYWGDQV